MANIYVTTSGNDSTGDGSSGNPYATPGKASSVAASGDVIWLKAGTYTILSSTANIATGRVSLAVGVRLEGYQTTIGDLGTPPVISAGAITSITVVETNGSAGGPPSAYVVNIIVDANSGASNIAFSESDIANLQGINLYLCVAKNAVTGFKWGSPYLCLAISCTTGFQTNWPLFSGAISCTTGFVAVDDTSVAGKVLGCVAVGGTTGFTAYFGVGYAKCVSLNQSGAGFDTNSYPLVGYTENIAYGCGTYGFKVASAAHFFARNATGSNTSGAYSNVPMQQYGAITLTADPFANSAGASACTDIISLFACLLPNSTAGGGALLRSAALPSYADVGPVQHQDAGGGGGPVGQSAMSNIYF